MRDIRRRPIPGPGDDAETKYVPIGLVRESDALRLRERPYSGIDDLADDLRTRGQATALSVRPMNDGYYELISGYRRRAALESIKAEHALVRIFRSLDVSIEVQAIGPIHLAEGASPISSRIR